MVPQLDLDRAVPDRTSTDALSPTAAAEVDFLAGRTVRWLEPHPRVHPAVRARALVVAGRADEARRLLVASAGSGWTPQGLAAAIWSASRVSVPELTDTMRDELASYEADSWVEDGVPLCTVGTLDALLAVASGDLERALSSFEDSVRRGDTRAPVWGALARLELARVQLTAAHLGGAGGHRTDGGSMERTDAWSRVAARRNLSAADIFFTSAGYEHLSGVTAALLRSAPMERPDAGDAGAEPDGNPRSTVTAPVAAPTLGFLVAPRVPTGGSWTVGFGVQPPAQVARRKGLVALSHLVANRDRRVPAVEIAAVLGRSGSAGDRDRDGTAELLVELRRLQSDEFLEPGEVAGSLRDLVFDEQQRSRVSKLLRRTIASLAGEHRVLGEHLATHVRTGYVCSYAASPGARWVL